MNTFEPYVPEMLPAVVPQYLQAQQISHDEEAAAATFAPHAVVVDDGRTYTGLAEIRDWLASSASGFTYTTGFTGQATTGENEWVVVNHLEGDFPGGVVDLRFQFIVADGLITGLVIAP